MTPTPQLRIELRGNLDERIPPGGTDTLTAFPDEEIDELLLVSQSVPEASWRGWMRKGVRVASGGGMTKVTFGTEAFSFTDPLKLADLAQKQAEYWYGLIPTDLLPVVSTAPAYAVGVCEAEMPGINTPVKPRGYDPSRLLTEW